MSATETQTSQDVDLGRLEDDAKARIAELEQQERRLALDALSDPELAAELASVQSERAAAEAQIRQAAMALEEIERREAQARADAEEAEREARLDRARKLEPRIEAAAKTFNERLVEGMVALREYHDLVVEQAGELGRPTGPAIGEHGLAFNSAVAFAMGQADIPRGLITLEALPRGRPQPLTRPQKGIKIQVAKAPAPRPVSPRELDDGGVEVVPGVVRRKL
jgi:hypothetical protein